MTRPLIVARARPPHSQARKRSSQGEVVRRPLDGTPPHRLSHLTTGSYTLQLAATFGVSVDVSPPPTPWRRRAEVSQRRTMRRAGSLAVVAATLPNCGDVAPGRSTRLNPSGIGKRSRDNNDVERNQAVAAVVAGSPLTNPTPPVTPHQVFAVLMNSKSRGSARARITPASSFHALCGAHTHPNHVHVPCPCAHSLTASQPHSRRCNR